MHIRKLSRREALARTGLALSGAVAAASLGVARAAETGSTDKTDRPFRYCLNTATIRGQKLGIVQEIELVAEAGYDGIEPWVESIQHYVQGGGTPSELRRRISDAGLTVEGSIGFPEWIVDDDERRSRGMERAKRELDLVAQIGAHRMAAPPAGATNLPKLDLLQAAERYRALLEVGDQCGVVPILELWGFSKNLCRLGECVWVAMETNHPKACVLADVFHMYKGGSDFHGMRLLGPEALPVLHLNDYPSDPPRETIDDSYRLYPGDGAAPVADILRALRRTGGQKVLSLELFNRKLWAEDPLTVLKTGLAKMKAVAERSGV